MRTTLTLDDDVAALLEGLRRKRKASFKRIVNDALRRGLQELHRPPASREAFRTRAVDLGACRIGNLDDVGEALAVAEGDAFK